jgi:hypothetical protein
MSQIYGRTDVLVDFQVPRDEGKSTHVVTRSPWSSVRLGAVDGVIAELAEGLFEDIEVEIRQVGDGRLVKGGIGVQHGFLKGLC